MPVFTQKKMFIVLCLFLIQGCAAASPDIKEKTSKGQQSQAVPREVLAAELAFDAGQGVISYTLPEDAFVRIRIGLSNGGAMLTHLLDWDFRPKGTHKEQWDGRISTGPVDYRSRQDLMITLKAYAASDPAPSLDNKWMRKAPGFEITFPGIGNGPGEQPALRGKQPVRILVDEDDMEWLSSARYELALFFDDLFVMEEEEGVNPFTYYVDTAKYNDGLHRITVNIVSSSGEAGAMTKIINIQNNKQEEQ